MKIWLMTIAMAVAFSAVTRAEDAKAEFDAGNHLTAARLLESQLGNGAPSAENYANLALAYQKAGDDVKAATNYQRALILDPGLGQANNALAGIAQGRQIPLPPRTWRNDITAVAHPDTLVAMGAMLFWVGAFGLVVASRTGKRAAAVRAGAIAAGLLGAAGVGAGCLADSRLASGRPAVVVGKDGVEVLTSPTNNSPAIISLPPGAPVRAISPRGAWTYVDLAGGAKGWVQTDQISPLVPGETL